MRLNFLKRIISLSLAVIMVFVFAACTKMPTETENTGSTAQTTVLSSDDELFIAIGSHASWPYNKNWAAWNMFREAVGGNIKITAIPNTEMSIKVALMMTSPEDLPDLIYANNKRDIETYAMSGALIAIDDYIDKMPNYTKFWETVPKDQREQYLLQRVSGDGKTYFPQVYGSDLVTNLHTWVYRKDVFDKHGLNTPETLDDMYQTAKKLKELYPKSYPVCMRDGLSNIQVIGPQWKPYFTYLTYYDYDNEQWHFGASEPTMLEIVEYFKKLRDEELISPDYLTINTKNWEELVATDRGFMMPEYVVRIDYFNIPNRKNNPQYTLAAMKPPRANNEAGQNKTSKMNMDPTGYIICNTKNQKRIDNAIKVVDWMYSDKACELLSWGKENETYTVSPDGSRRFILNDKENAVSKYGLRSYGTCLRADPKAVCLTYSDEQMDSLEFINKNSETKINPTMWLSFNNEESKKVSDMEISIKTYVEEALGKFLLGQRPVSEWDAFQKDLKGMGVDELLVLYSDAYNRIRR